ncbi:MAG: DUF3857 domain-containing protein [Flavobacteriales bacterium]|nr:DUF3857 domain-containing protein [Flavobacteriales bacterium]MCW8913927.1 DUF3857 domain-containing protein [Flavobacteriales bacterium]MCW8937273.1 DUF3857 domain-containing protein [Flavobacteriales bacterium]MCW8939991.1 DUF3857 domain-containing protein [Flavobacteriales bacterium]MCW8967211.1 DUF3857 domain-containing protein [Flavobacteriales bacterium]
MKKLFATLLVLSTLNIAHAQLTPFYKSYNWSENIDKMNILKDTLIDEEVLVLKDYASNEFSYPDDKQNTLTQYVLTHKAYLLRTNNAIEDFNKVYLSFDNSSEILKTKARVITPSNKIIELDSTKILTAVDEETNVQYKYFAFEGIEVGSIVEYLYVIKKRPYYEGSYVRIQSEYPIFNLDFHVITPNNLIFKFKTYNNTDSISNDTLANGKWDFNIKYDYIPSLKYENNAAYQSKLMALVYKLDRNTYGGTRDISSYSTLIQNMYDFLHYNEDKNKKTVEKFLKQMKFKASKTTEEDILFIEDYLKKNIYINENNGSQELKSIDFITSNKLASELGILKLYAQIFAALEIEMELVFSGNRLSKKFDSEYEATTFLEDYLIYFPSINKYMAPTNLASRVGLPTFTLTHNYGLFIKEVALGGFKTGLGEIKFIDPVPYTENTDKMYIDVSFNEENITNQKIFFNRQMSGYYAKDLQPFYYLITGKDKTELNKQLFTNINSELEPENIVVKNENAADLGKKPFIIEAEFETDVFIEKAADKVIFEIGNLIGPQTEIYDSLERKLPVELNYTKYYYREIKVKIPKNYKIVNLDDLNIENYFINNGDTSMAFTSKYTVKDNELVVVCEEYYKNIEIPVKHYQEYRKIINSAADFNKIKLILEPN